MKVVIAIDSFKGSLTSTEAAEAVREGILAARPDANIVIKPVADGGEGPERSGSRRKYAAHTKSLLSALTLFFRKPVPQSSRWPPPPASR